MNEQLWISLLNYCLLPHLLVFDCEQGERAKGVARSKFPLLVRPQNGASGSSVAGAAAGAFPGLDARLGGHGAVPEPIGLVVRLHDVAVVGEPRFVRVGEVDCGELFHQLLIHLGRLKIKARQVTMQSKRPAKSS